MAPKVQTVVNSVIAFACLTMIISFLRVWRFGTRFEFRLARYCLAQVKVYPSMGLLPRDPAIRCKATAALAIFYDDSRSGSRWHRAVSSLKRRHDFANNSAALKRDAAVARARCRVVATQHQMVFVDDFSNALNDVGVVFNTDDDRHPLLEPARGQLQG